MATLVTISGTLADFGLESLAPLSPQLIFIAAEPAVSGSHLLARRRIVVTPAVDGAWTVQLVPSTQTNPETTYTLRIEWLGYGIDVLKGIVVPNADANIGDLPSNPSEKFWVGPIPPANPQKNLWWLDTSAYPYVWKEWV